MSTESLSDIDDDDRPVAPRDSHWHYSMIQPRVWGLFDIRAIVSFLFCFFKLFELWKFKLWLVGVTVFVFTLLELRRITPDVAFRQVVAWLRGPYMPGIATRSQTYLGHIPRPSTSSFGGSHRRGDEHPANQHSRDL